MREPGRRAATVADVAAAAGVSKATAARALGAYGAVSERVRERVRGAADDLGYRRNEVARSMSTGRSRTIGMIVGDIENPAFAQATRGAADVADEAGFDLILSNSGERVDSERKAIDVQLAKRVDGLVVAPASSSTLANYAPIIESGRPVAFFDRLVHGFEADAVIAANRDGAARLARLLLGFGHRRIAFISTLSELGDLERRIVIGRAGEIFFEPRLESSAIEDRVAGFAAALRAAGVVRPLEHVRLDARTQGIAYIVRQLTRGPAPVTAIVASDSIVAIEAFRALRESGLSVPGDVSLVGFDNADWTAVSEPGITVMSQPLRELGATAARMLIERIQGVQRPATVRVLPQELIERASVGPASVG
ncbi:LacI family DNA-binding transcriptional regulator [Microbacterium marinilacus]|nr:LacI family DNA-binding transcriptional regulator [Microbacterium marinilacus]